LSLNAFVTEVTGCSELVKLIEEFRSQTSSSSGSMGFLRFHYCRRLEKLG